PEMNVDEVSLHEEVVIYVRASGGGRWGRSGRAGGGDTLATGGRKSLTAGWRKSLGQSRTGEAEIRCLGAVGNLHVAARVFLDLDAGWIDDGSALGGGPKVVEAGIVRGLRALGSVGGDCNTESAWPATTKLETGPSGLTGEVAQRRSFERKVP